MTREQAKKRAKELVSQMTVEEKVTQLLYNSPAIDRLGIPEYNWWNEASHGVARSGMATVFPHAIALAATFDPALIGRIGDAVSTEARAKYNNSVLHNDRDIYKGLTYWTPNINIFRDPRWGRGQETFGEDPYLTAVMGMEYIGGLQGDGEFLKSAACSKHYAVHSGPETMRHSFNAEVSEQDLWETYLPAFEWTVKAGVA
ncbi:MAG: glycoside hydrolase family 3 protein, partial [Clostridia bacterium]|nr:glycoside hydrolase family 3 protein [Clostridia bacterium]